MVNELGNIDLYGEIVIPLASSLIGAAVAIVVTRYSTKQQLSAQYKTDKRIEWINSVRILISEFISYALDYYERIEHIFEDDIDALNIQKEKSHFELNLRQSKLKVFFNFNGNLDSKITTVMDKILRQVSMEYEEIDGEDLLNNINILTKLSQVYFKLEWERCKMEVEGKNSKKIKSLMDSLEVEYMSQQFKKEDISSDEKK